MKKMFCFWISCICFCFTLSIGMSYAQEPSTLDTVEKAVLQSEDSVYKSRSNKKEVHDDSEVIKIEKAYSLQLKEWKEPVKEVSETKLKNTNLYGDENNLILEVPKGKDKKNLKLEENALRFEGEVKKDSLDDYFKNIKEMGDDSRLDAYIAHLAEKEGQLDYAYEHIREALSKQPDNDLYQKLFRKIYEQRTKNIIKQREEIIKSAQ